MPTHITLNQILIIGTIAGFIAGLIPLGLGLSKNRRMLGILGLVLSTVAGMVLSLLGALPVSGLFIWLIMRKKAEPESRDADLSGDDPLDAVIEDSSERTN